MKLRGGKTVSRAGDFASTWTRRAITIPGVTIAWCLIVVTTPVLLPLTAILDLAQRRRLARARALLMLLVYLSCEMVGVTGSFWIWLRWRHSRERFMDANFRLQCWWGNSLFRSAVRIFGMKLTVDHPELARGGPVLVFPRHVSPIDNLLPLALIMAPYRVRLRWVINRMLLRAPAIDIVGNRLPNQFVGTGGNGGHTTTVADLANDLAEDEGVMIFAEGGLFSEQKRAKAIERLRDAGQTELAERAEGMPHLLPPRLGGPLGLLERAPGADVLFMGHVGLQGSTRYMSIAAGELVGKELRVRFWRVPAEEIPRTPEQQTAWLYDWWERMDRWIADPEAEHSTPGSVEAEATHS